MGRTGRSERRALNKEELVVVIALGICCALIAGIILAILDLPLASGVVVTVILAAAIVVAALRGRRASPVALRDPAVTTAYPDFTQVMRGYDMAAVDDVVRRSRMALASEDPGVRALARKELLQVALPARFRGYHQGQVDEYLRRVSESLYRIE